MSYLPPLEIMDMAMDAVLPFYQDIPLRIPRLLDKPQNPILDTLRFWKTHPKTARIDGTKHANGSPREDKVSQDSLDLQSDAKIWTNVLTRPETKSLVISWDTVCTQHRAYSHYSAFLSEQSGTDTTAGIYFVRPNLQDPLCHRKHVSPEEVFNALRWTITGSSSALHVWDQASHTFILRDTLANQSGVVVIHGLDEDASDCFMHRFLLIGTLTRRIEIFIQRLRASYLSPVFHAFVHSIASILAWITTFVSTSPLLKHDNYTGSYAQALTATWVFYADLEAELNELSFFCGISSHLSPSLYRSLPETDTDLLSQIYDRLQDLVEKRAPRHITAQLAFIFTMTAQIYFNDICLWVGYPSNLVPTHPIVEYGGSRYYRRSAIFLDDAEHEELHNEHSHLVEDEKCFPSFLPDGLGHTLNRARKSLVLLRAARPNHETLSGSSALPSICWRWTHKDVEVAFYDQKARVTVSFPTRTATMQQRSEPSPYLDEMQIFELFGLEPGASIARPLSGGTVYKTFLDEFPPGLSCLTPTLPDLTSLVLRPLAGHVVNLSTALVDLFLTQSSYLHFPSHLRLLRSYLLLTSHPLKATLQSALFSDSHGDDDSMSTYPMHGNSQFHPTSPSDCKRIIGISYELTPDGSWPPAGASLSFLLRTVIVDSLNLEYRPTNDHHIGDGVGQEIDGQPQIIEEAEWRLGFAIRDLPVGSDAKWLRARSIEALDFLYMEYQPPEPLATLITATILSKYHRIFAFNLRLMRVDNVVRALFRMTRKNAPQVFPTFPASYRLFLHFRFVSHAFVLAISSYVYDTAIRSNFDAFLAILMPPPEDSKTKPRFADVFALADYHSSVMDDILSACLLRSGQKPVGDLLRGALEIILEFGVFMSDVVSDEVKEYQAVGFLEALFQRFLVKVTTLVKVLRALVERGAMAGRSAVDARLPLISPTVRVNDCLTDLLVRIDVTEWWRIRSSKHASA